MTYDDVPIGCFFSTISLVERVYLKIDFCRVIRVPEGTTAVVNNDAWLDGLTKFNVIVPKEYC